ncbi:hypothetical protein ACOSQ3_011199 [Xanthoceras sorbifolium]
MEYQKVTSAATFSKKLTNSHSFGGSSIYDGVFSSVPAVKVGSRVEKDYGEIFGGAGSSSIPILDAPELNEKKVSVDVNSSRLDYSKIFGGFGEFDFAASHEQLSATKPKKRDTFAEEPRTTAETGPFSSKFSEENQVFSRGASGQPFDDVKQFKMSYHKTNQGRENGINGATHIAQLNAVPGYSCLINEVAPSQMTEGDKPSSVNKSYVNINFSGEITAGKDSRKAVSLLPAGGVGKQPSGGVKVQKKPNESRSNSIDMLFDAHENGRTTHPSKVPLSSSQLNNLGKNKGDFERSVSSKFRVSKSHSCEDAAGFCSPPYFDEEVDSNSVAAASAAAVKKAIEEAQAKIRLAKEIMERKKEGLQNHVKLRSNDGSKAEERREGNITNKSNKSIEEAWDKCGKVDIPMQVFPGLGTIESVKTDQVIPDLTQRDKLFFTKEASGETHGDRNKSTLVDHRQEEMKESEAEELGESGARMMNSMNVCEWEDKSFVRKTFEKPEENGKKLKAVEAAHKQEEVKKLNVVRGACELKECANEPKSDQEVNNQEEYVTKSTVAGLQEEIDTTSKASHVLETCEKKQRRLWDLTASRTTLELRELRDSEFMKMRILTDEQKWLENENKREVLKLEENDVRSEDGTERGENEEELQEIFYDTENQDIPSKEGAEETSDKAQEQEEIGVGINDFHDGELSGKILEEDGEVEVKERLIEAEEDEEILMEAYQIKETEKRQKEIHEWLETEKIQTTIEQRAADEKMEVAHKSLDDFRKSLQSANGLCKRDEMEILSETLEVAGHEENNEYLEVFRHDDIGGIMEGTPAYREMEIETESNADEMSDELEEKEVFEAETAGFSQVVLEFDKMTNHVKDTTEDFPFEYNGVNVGITDIDVRQKQHDQHANESKTVCNLGKHVEESAYESEENFEDVEEVEVIMKREEDESNSEFSDEERWNESEEIMEASPIPSIFQEKEETTEIANKTETSQNTEKDEENHSETPTTEEREAEGTMQKEMEREEEHVRKIDEAKEKEREREKERIAVERAIREARERAFTEARERAERAAVERANAEARRRAMAEARGKLEKVSAEANDKLSVDKSSMEARIKAQRAAVERATAEARERALEKAMSEKAALEARNQAVKFSGASRDNGKRRNFPSNDSRYKGSGPTRNSGDPSSSNHGVTHSAAKTDNVDGESTQRDKAKLERHHRTAERAAKALAEKNMRDLLAQKEQAERHRLAETVDADVKRWSSGKQGNLRALLSTLQYILGPDSGWQPVPLTDLITSTAVKKTYRKATLFVHPDKLQQRGASIQQKYICEKVFDLLKEGWNKFSAEDR